MIFFKHERLVSQEEKLINNINRLVDSARKNEIPIIWVRQEFKKDLSNATISAKKSGLKYVIEGTKGASLVEGLVKKKADLEVVKTRYSAFYKTQFENILQELEIDTLVIAGINTHACIRMCAIDAYQRDYDVIVAKDCVASWDDEHHKITMNYFEPTIAKVKTNLEIIKWMEQ